MAEARDRGDERGRTGSDDRAAPAKLAIINRDPAGAGESPPPAEEVDSGVAQSLGWVFRFDRADRELHAIHHACEVDVRIRWGESD